MTSISVSIPIFYHDVGEISDISQSEASEFGHVMSQGYATHDPVSLETMSYLVPV